MKGHGFIRADNRQKTDGLPEEKHALCPIHRSLIAMSGLAVHSTPKLF